jgi:hypothetical protein
MVKKWNLSLQKFSSCRRHGKPARPIDFRKLPHLARALRPLHRKSVAAHSRRIDVPTHSPCIHHLPAGLPNSNERPEFASRLRAGFFRELAFGRFERLFSLREFALGDRPGTVILLRPKRPAGMHKKNLGHTAPLAKEQQPGACSGSSASLRIRARFVRRSHGGHHSLANKNARRKDLPASRRAVFAKKSDPRNFPRNNLRKRIAGVTCAQSQERSPI